MKNTYLIVLFSICSIVAGAQENAKLKTGMFDSYDDFAENRPSVNDVVPLKPVVRVNQVEARYSDTLYSSGLDVKKAFAIYDGKNLFVRTEDTLYRRMDYIGRYPFVKITTKVHLEGRWITVNKTPVWEEEHDEVQSYVMFINRQGKWVGMGFESVRELLKGNRDFINEFDKEKWNNGIFVKYLLKMNERYPLK